MDNITTLISQERSRQDDELTLIASENYVSKNVLDATGSVLTNKYSEGYPGKRYYAGNRIIDQVEIEANRLAKEVYQTDYHVNLQPYSGSPANLAAYSALLKPGDMVLAMRLDQGGHLTHGHPVSLTGNIYTFIHYGVDPETELIDYQQVRKLALEHKPKLIVCGTTAYSMFVDYLEFSKIAHEVGAWLMADIAHVSGLIAGGAHPSPFGIADVITSSTHKTLRGPRGGMVFCRPDLAKALDKAVFPGLQGGPHMNVVAAKGIAFQEALAPSFTMYAAQIVRNARTMAYALQRQGFRLVADGTETHLILMDLRSTSYRGRAAQALLEEAGLIVNMNALPFDPHPPTDPSGIRLGTAALTTRGMKDAEMTEISELIARLLHGSVEPSTAKQVVQSLARRFRIPAHP